MTVHADDEQVEAASGRNTRRRWRGPVQFRRHQGGATAVEFGFIAIPFFMLIFAIIEFTLLFWTNQELETAVSQISRSVLTGESKQRYTDPAQNTEKFKQDICNFASVLVTDCMQKLSVDVRTYTSFAEAQTGTAGSNPLQGGALNTDGFGYNQPQGKQIVVVRAVLAYPVLFSGWSNALVNITKTKDGEPTKEHALIASTAFRTEPFL
jgi:Flp pilus assembly protein TadG